MSRAEEFLGEQIQLIYDALKSWDLPVFEDEIAPDEEKALLENYHCFVYETGDIIKNNDMKTMTQSVTVYYYSENLDDIDKRTLSIIASIDGQKRISFVRSRKQRLQKKDTEQFVDRVILTFARGLSYGKC